MSTVVIVAIFYLSALLFAQIYSDSTG